MTPYTGKLNELLRKRGLTQTQLSDRTGIPQGTISRFDKKTRHEIKHLVSIANALNVRIEDLFEDVPESATDHIADDALEELLEKAKENEKHDKRTGSN